MKILELQTLTPSQTADLLDLMHELAPTIAVTGEMLEQAAEAPGTHLFAAVGDDERILGCASLCVFDSPTGRKASVEDVVVSSDARRQGIGRALMDHIIGYALRELAPIDLHLTSRPERVAANEMYKRMGFEKRETNVYRMLLSR